MEATSSAVSGSDEEMKAALRRWLSERRADLRIDNPVHLHVDELMRRLGRTNYHPLRDLLNPFISLIELLGDQVQEIMAGLEIRIRIPDRPSLTFAELIAPPNLAALDTELTDTPPAIYLIHRRSRLRAPTWEHYEVPLKWDPFTGKRDDVLFYYVVPRCVG